MNALSTILQKMAQASRDLNTQKRIEAQATRPNQEQGTIIGLNPYRVRLEFGRIEECVSRSTGAVEVGQVVVVSLPDQGAPSFTVLGR